MIPNDKVLSHLKSKGVPPEDKQYKALLKLLKAQTTENQLSINPQQKETISQQLQAYKQNTQSRLQTPITHVPSVTVEFVSKDFDVRKRERIAERLALLQGLLTLCLQLTCERHY